MPNASFSFIATDTIRTKSYLQLLNAEGLRPNTIIYLKRDGVSSMGIEPCNTNLNEDLEWSIKNWGGRFDCNLPIEDTIKQLGCQKIVSPSCDINDPSVISIIKSLGDDLIVYSGYGGVILRGDVLNCGKYFLHIHGGLLPSYKGSTTSYYSILKENLFATSGIYMDANIDMGPIISRKIFITPLNKMNIDYYYDPLSRALHLVEILKKVSEINTIPINAEDCFFPYYVIHPVLKHISILSS